MEITLDPSTVRQLRLSAADAIEEGDTETLREDLIEAFDEEQIDAIELRIDSADIYEFISQVLDEWAGDDVDDLFELLEGQLAEADVELSYAAPEDDDADGEDGVAVTVDDDDDEDVEDVDDEGPEPL
ncbi:MAG TPA: hypothetical protein RMH85_08310 [Polyangiaceae bacterium LLY-WYZ-15_(1-7)]|nr:hypothetical protein [Myxococcales bacterium]MAT29256.1 hypothetical protein [Sandaracinus sp.]HJK92032.1 hypothetical protein [Polyangiaceae bacterium LLY-WYZ-15_(1-7)]HJL03957.1 hypothetical protein [Polyangiaceae bacterium LLY-WYZ-15_(1-7)]HJL08486.1 hypothetical protein [Polyangiaceae bacterium LLY-WYZ-15_(1-7)]